MFATVHWSFIFPVLINSHPIDHSSYDRAYIGYQASVKLLEAELEVMYEEKVDSITIKAVETRLSDLYNLKREEERNLCLMTCDREDAEEKQEEKKKYLPISHQILLFLCGVDHHQQHQQHLNPKLLKFFVSDFVLGKGNCSNIIFYPE